MKKLITTLAVLALVLFGAFKAAVWWFTDQDFRQARLAMADYGVIERGTIHSSVAGQLVLQEASYQHFQLTQPLQVASFSFDAGSPLALLATLIEPANLPGQWRATAEGLRLALDATMFRSWVGAGQESNPGLFSPVCGPDHRQRLGSGDLVRVGITAVSGEALLHQDTDRLYFELNTTNTGSLEIDWPGARFSLVDPASVVASTDAPMIVTLRDGGTMRKIAAYCARESGVGVSEWTGIVLATFHNQLNQAGYEPSQQVLSLYRRWLAEGGELTVALVPASDTFGLPVREDADDGTATLVATYNGATVPDLYLTPVTPVVAEPPAAALEPLIPEDGGPTEPGWRSVAIERAGQWIGHRVRVTLNTGRVVEGRLTRQDDRQLEVARPVGGGEVAYPMALRAITGIEVWRRGSRID